MKKIKVEQLRVGMYVEEICIPWLESPFWTRTVMVDSADKLAKILATSATEVVIDPRRGSDIAAEPVAPVAVEEAPAAPAPFQFPAVTPTSTAAEMQHAELLLAQSKDAVNSMFHEARMGKAIDAEQVQQLVDDIAVSVMRNPDAMVGLARLKNADDYTYMHSVAVCALMIALARELKLPDGQVRELGMAGLMHDVGKMLVPQDILLKPGGLTTEEFDAIKHHPVAGHQLLQASAVSEVVLDVCLHHHEKVNGTGYPAGLKGDQITLAAKMGAICDVYDAITSDRPYKTGWCPAASLSKMTEWCDGHFDPVVFAAFVKCMGIYPIGTVVRLQSGRLAVIVDRGVGKSLLTPSVRVFFDTASKSLMKPELLDLSAAGVKERIVGREDATRWGITDTSQYWT